MFTSLDLNKIVNDLLLCLLDSTWSSKDLIFEQITQDRPQVVTFVRNVINGLTVSKSFVFRISGFIVKEVLCKPR